MLASERLISAISTAVHRPVASATANGLNAALACGVRRRSSAHIIFCLCLSASAGGMFANRLSAASLDVCIVAYLGSFINQRSRVTPRQRGYPHRRSHQARRAGGTIVAALHRRRRRQCADAFASCYLALAAASYHRSSSRPGALHASCIIKPPHMPQRIALRLYINCGGGSPRMTQAAACLRAASSFYR